MANTGLGDLTPIGLGISALQTGIGIVEDINAKRKQKQLLGQLTPYKTPQEVYDVLHATQANAGEGLDASTLAYLNNETNQSFSSSIDAATKLGADPNTLSEIFSKKIDAEMKIGAENHAANTANFSQYINALDTVASNKAAEQKSQQDIVKDKLQSTGVNLQSASGNISGGINTALSVLSSDQIAKLYKQKYGNANNTTPSVFLPTGNDNGLSVDNTNQGIGNNDNNTFS